jgi:hypothetical protein
LELDFSFLELDQKPGSIVTIQIIPWNPNHESIFYVEFLFEEQDPELDVWFPFLCGTKTRQI